MSRLVEVVLAKVGMPVAGQDGLLYTKGALEQLLQQIHRDPKVKSARIEGDELRVMINAPEVSKISQQVRGKVRNPRL